MKINLHQKIVICVAMLLIALMTLFPPWIRTHHTESFHSENPDVYSFIGDPPIKTYKKSKLKLPSPRYGIKIDLPRLSCQILAVLSIMTILLTVTSKHETN